MQLPENFSPLVSVNVRYGDGVDNTVEENSSIFSLSESAGCRQQGHAGSKTLHQQNPPVLNGRCRLMQVDLYNGHKTVAVVVVSANMDSDH